MYSVGVFGVYNSGSIGDQAILQGVIEQLQTRSRKLRIQVFAMNPSILTEALRQYEHVTVTSSIPIREGPSREREINQDTDPPVRLAWLRHSSLFSLVKAIWVISRFKFWHRKYIEVRGMDLLIIGGGNILMDLYSLLPMHILIFTFLAKIARVPVMFYAVGAGPIRTVKGKILLKLAGRLVKSITVRDSESASLLSEKHITHKAILSADPALTLRVNQEQNNPKPPDTGTRPLKLGITVVPYYDPRYWPNPNSKIYNSYVKSMADLVDRIIRELGCQALFFATNYPADSNTALDVRDCMAEKGSVEILEQRLSVQEIIRAIRSCDLVIGTRLHSVILSYICLVPFLGIVYQPKVRSFCTSIGLGSLAVDLYPEAMPDSETILSKINHILNHREEIVETMENELSNSRALSDVSPDLALQLIGIPRDKVSR